MRIFAWPLELPPQLSDLPQMVAAAFPEAEVVEIDSLAEISTHRDGATTDAVLAVIDAALLSGASATEVIDGLDALSHAANLDIVVVVGDGYLGTDAMNLAPALGAAAAIAAIRSIAVRRDGTGRANAVCVPDAMFDNAGSQRAPLSQETEAADVANAVGFFLGDTGGYLSGQVLFVDGGRHLFSSMSA